MTLEEKIYSFEEKNTIVGIGSALPFYNIKHTLENIEVPFVEKDIEKRINPMLIRNDAKSIIALGISYNKVFKGTMDDKIRGKISIGAMGKDYHLIIKEKLEYIKYKLNIEGDIFVDTGPLVDREVAKRCGLGIIGKSGNIINKKLGSIFFIGYIITNIKLNSNKILYNEDLCKNCNKCIKACPSNSILENGFDYKKCISYLTQKKQLESEIEKTLINRQIYGCDICQKVCPYNKGIYEEYIYDLDIFYPNIEFILNMTNKEFEKTYKKTAAGWRGKKILQRNAIIALANYKYSEKSIKLLENLKNDIRQDIRDYTLWAMEKLNSKR